MSNCSTYHLRIRVPMSEISESPSAPSIACHRSPCRPAPEPKTTTLRRARCGGMALGLVAATAWALVAGAADAKVRPRAHHVAAPHRVMHGSDYHPPYAALVVDDNSGQVLHEVSPDE